MPDPTALRQYLATAGWDTRAELDEAAAIVIEERERVSSATATDTAVLQQQIAAGVSTLKASAAGARADAATIPAKKTAYEAAKAAAVQQAVQARGWVPTGVTATDLKTLARSLATALDRQAAIADALIEGLTYRSANDSNAALVADSVSYVAQVVANGLD